MPWSRFWDQNFFLVTNPMFQQVLASPYARGAVSGVGLITAIAGVFELAAAFSSRRVRATAREKPHPGA